MRRLAFLVLSGISCLRTFGQLPERYVSLGVGPSFYTLQDPTVSPMTYGGGLLSVGLGFEKYKRNHISRLTLAGDLGRLRSANATERRPMSSQVYRVDLAYSYLRWLHPGATRWRWFLGGTYRWHNSIRLTEQNDTGMISFWIANSLALSGGVERKVPIFGKTTTLNWQGEVPLISHVIRPGYLNLYNYIDPENDWLKERLEASRFVTLNRYPALLSTLNWRYPIAGSNELRLSYEWSFYHYDQPFRANVGRHTLLLSLFVRM